MDVDSIGIEHDTIVADTGRVIEEVVGDMDDITAAAPDGTTDMMAEFSQSHTTLVDDDSLMIQMPGMCFIHSLQSHLY